MKKSRNLKFTLKKETISNLDQKGIKGGHHHTCTPTCTQTALFSRCGNQQCF